ncbi:Cellulose synthase-like protein [Vigna angularis]|uniref:Cellulose synthase-like protein n=1 Tax=Phaseolus angularis TaxID=3914 RepID=A0A8T0K1Y0_PHAAN|nr:cellulose synthase-like protein E6 [Vigna angularis]KAG2390739.1 Cellulose synthase-like protein [Vigna angularis]
MREEGMREDESPVSLFETKEGRFRGLYKVFATTIFGAVCLIWVYRVVNMGRIERGRWCWMSVMVSEFGFGLYWIITQSVRWRILYHTPFKHTLLNRYDDENLPAVDIFVCTADPKLEPPCMVMNTVLSAMAYNYPANKLNVYLSDDGGSELTFYALLKASIFSKHWLPFCRRFNVEPRSPEVFFAHPQNSSTSTEYQKAYLHIKKLYEEMKSEIESAAVKGELPENVRNEHRGFSEWNPKSTKQDHQSIVQIIVDGRDRNSVDEDGFELPTVVYMAREKRPNHPHHFKAGAVNALIRVSSQISNAPFILNLDCDMYSNNADTIQEILCFFLDETKGQDIAYVQFPQSFSNITKNDQYGNSYLVSAKYELAGICGYGAALFCGTGCLHRRESLSGSHLKDYKVNWEKKPKRNNNRTIDELNEASKALATCTYEEGTLWGKEMGLVYGIPVEDVATGLVISCRGWKSIYYNPEKKAFLGIAPTTLDVACLQHMRWSEGLFQVFFSKYCPFIYGHGKIHLGVQMGYCNYLLWAPMSLPTLCYVILLPISLFHGIPLFPKLSSMWVIPFAYAFLATYGYSLCEYLTCGSTTKAWWNLQRIKFIHRVSSYLFGFIDTMTKQLGLSQTNFVITDKVVTEDVQTRYEQGIIEFGGSSIMLTILGTVALLNLFGLVGGIVRILMELELSWSQLMMQITVSFLVVMINLPVYEALFIRSDKGCISSSIMLKSIVVASLACYLGAFIC